jgi:hypothetical protein
MIKMMKSMLTALALTAATVASANDIKELNFGIIATEKASAMKQMWEPFLEDMSKSVGIKVNGSTRWLNIGIQIQPSEIMRLAMPMTLAWFFYHFEKEMGSWHYF